MALSVDRYSDGDIDSAEVKVDGELVVLVTHHKKSGKVDVTMAEVSPAQKYEAPEPTKAYKKE